MGKVSDSGADITGEPVIVGVVVSFSMRRTIALCVGLVSAGPALAGVHSFGARMDEARWVMDGSRLQCTLSQQIPLYGTVRFQWKTGDGLDFSVQVLRQPLKAGSAQLTSTAPAWMHGVQAVDLGQVPFNTGDVPFRFGQPLARRLLSELEKGMYPTLTYPDWADGRDRVTVRIASLNVRTALGEFLHCAAQLLPYGFAAVKETEVHFAFGSTAIAPQAAADLDRIAAYLKVATNVREVRIAGYADSVGFRRYNERLSRKRSAAVKNYLLAKGAKHVKFVIAGFGEDKPQVSNRSARGRAENRRVMVYLVK